MKTFEYTAGVVILLTSAAMLLLAQGTSQTFNNCTVVVTDTPTGKQATITCPAPPPPLTITTPVTLPRAKVGNPFISSLAVLAAPKGGVPPYTYAISSANPPAWLKLSSTGVLTGTPTAAGSFPFNFTVTDSATGGANATLGTTIVAAVGRR